MTRPLWSPFPFTVWEKWGGGNHGGGLSIRKKLAVRTGFSLDKNMKIA
jgi:hypothetical protein